MLPSRVAIIGNYLPRRCGIATFTTDCATPFTPNTVPPSFSRFRSTILRKVTAIRPGFASFADELASYRQAADFLNFSNIDLVCLQHEYGIFGGPAGGHIWSCCVACTCPWLLPAYGSSRAGYRSASGNGGNRCIIGSADRYEPAVFGDFAAGLLRSRFQNRSNSPWHSRLAVHGSHFL